MLRGLTEDFKAAGHEISVLIDSRIAAMNPPITADHMVEITSPAMTSVALSLAAESADAAYAIAPEADDNLRSIVEHIEDSGAISMNSKTAAIGQASDKTTLATRARRLGLESPKTLHFPFDEPAEQIAKEIKEHLGYPAVVKPSASAGCSGLSIVNSESQVAAAAKKIAVESVNGALIAQELIKGIPTSVSLISTSTDALPVSLNLQDITLATPEAESAYNGGQVPLEHPSKTEAFEAAKCIVESFNGLRGYTGVDMVIAGDKTYVVEVNPRLTTSYIGLRKVATFNVAQAIADSVLSCKLPQATQTKGYACFSKTETAPCSGSNWPRIVCLNSVASPPFPLANNKKPCALLESVGNTPEEANEKLTEAKKQLNQICKGEQNAW
jgi:predicted ATP-grasp superfamily ATP-dependent carboligase